MEPLIIVAGLFSLPKIAEPAAKALFEQVALFVAPWHERRSKEMSVDTHESVIKKIRSSTHLDDESKAELETSMLGTRALERSYAEQKRHQANMEAITAEAMRQLPANAAVQVIEPDWLEHFYSAVRHVSNEDAQVLWAKVLAGEAVQPNSFSKRSLETLRLFTKTDGDCLQEIASRCLLVEGEPTCSCSSFFNPDPDLRPLYRHARDLGLIHEAMGGETTPVIYPTDQEWMVLSEFYAGGRVLMKRREPGRLGTRLGGSALTAVGRQLVTLPEKSVPPSLLRYIAMEQSKIAAVRFEGTGTKLDELSSTEISLMQ